VKQKAIQLFDHVQCYKIKRRINSTQLRIFSVYM